MLGFWDYLTKNKPSEEVKALKESRPYLRSLRYGYANLAPPTGGGPNFAYAVQNPEAAAALGKGKMVPAKPFPGMEDKKTKTRSRAWQKGGPA